MSGITKRLLLDETLGVGIRYVGLPVIGDEGSIGAFLSWSTAAFAATFTLELTSLDEKDAPVSTAGSAATWAPSGVTIAAATGAGADSRMINVEGVRQARARLRIDVTVAGVLKVADGRP